LQLKNPYFKGPLTFDTLSKKRPPLLEASLLLTH
jgi:hypothetical protein